MALNEYDGYKLPPTFDGEITPEIQNKINENKKKADELLNRVKERHKEERIALGLD